MRFIALGTCLLLMALSLLGESQTFTQGDQAPLLELPIFPARIKKSDLPLTRALEEVGIRVRGGYVLFGVEVHGRAGKQPNVSLELEPGSTLGSALRQIFRQLPNYEYRVVSPHLINVQPVGAEKNAQDILNIRVEDFDVVGEQPSSLLSAPQFFIAQLRQRLAPPNVGPPHPGGTAGPIMRGSGPGVTLHLRNVTIRELLNAVSEGTESFPAQYSPLGWFYSFEPDPASPAGGKHSWMWLISVPHNWKEEAEKGKNPSQ
jgi:hypothetical protein